MFHRLLKYKNDNKLSRFKLNLKNSLRGLAVLKSLPSVVFFNSVKHSYWATGETYALHIPSAGITDSDALPDSVLYPIPGNDDAFGSVYFMNKLLAKMVLVSKIETMLKVYKSFCLKLAKWAERAQRMAEKKKFKKNFTGGKSYHNKFNKKTNY